MNLHFAVWPKELLSGLDVPLHAHKYIFQYILHTNANRLAKLR